LQPEFKVHTPIKKIRKSDELDKSQEKKEEQISNENKLQLT